MTYAVGSLVKARGREWVVLPESETDLLVLRPLGGTEDEVTGIYLPLEPVESARFSLPDPTRPGDYLSSRLLRDALRLGFRSSAGPFRSFANLGVEPRPYQLVPLLMALKLNPVRLLIADDVGIGKTVEASLILRELLDRGEIQRFAVICPPHLAEQWQKELRDKFHLEAELVLSGTAARLERQCGFQSIFEKFPYVIVSMDFIKSDTRRDEFIRTCPEFVIVDEAHTCAAGFQGKGGRHQRHQLVSRLAQDAGRHMVFVTATPHSGNEDAFRSLLSLLSPRFATLPANLTGKENEQHRRTLAEHFVQRRRGDIRHYMDADTPFPEREDKEEHYKLSPEYQRLFEKVLGYAREIVGNPQGERSFQQRVRWWSALALLRALASSPAAAAATLRSRAAVSDADTPEAVDQIGRTTVLDLSDGEGNDMLDTAPGSDIWEEDDESQSRRRLLEMAREADALRGDKDLKLVGLLKHVKGLLAEGYRPIVFCRFIQTAEYVAEALRDRLRGVEVISVTGLLPPAEREARVLQLAESEKRLLVCTDCLSEGINLQSSFDAVIHYDLSWNPTRHEQREGRVDRYGQRNPRVRVLTYYGIDNQIDGVVLDVLLRKHKTIRTSLGISVPLPVDSEQVVQAVLEGLLLRGASAKANRHDDRQGILPGFEDIIFPEKEELHKQWELTSEQEKRSQTMFAQHAIKVTDVAQELAAVREAIGAGVDVANFAAQALQRLGATVTRDRDGQLVTFDLTETPRPLREAIGVTHKKPVKARFELPVGDDELYLTRTHPMIEGLASHVLDTALDPLGSPVAARCGVIRSRGVQVRRTLLLVRFRYHILTRRDKQEYPLLAEDCRLLAFSGAPGSPEWLPQEETERLLQLTPDANVPTEQATSLMTRLLDQFDPIWPHLEQQAKNRGEELLEAHRRIRASAHMTGVSYKVEPQLPPDVLGLYLYLPAIAPGQGQ